MGSAWDNYYDNDEESKWYRDREERKEKRLREIHSQGFGALERVFGKDTEAVITLLKTNFKIQSTDLLGRMGEYFALPTFL